MRCMASPSSSAIASAQVISAGEHWRIFGFWFTDDGVDSVYPAGYVPLRPLPIEDFVAKFTVKVVIDGGTPQQKTYVFSAAEALRTDITLDQLVPGSPPFPMAAIMPRLQPLSVGDHTLQVIWVLSAQHCDGLAAVVEENCLPAGELERLGRRGRLRSPHRRTRNRARRWAAQCRPAPARGCCLGVGGSAPECALRESDGAHVGVPDPPK